MPFVVIPALDLTGGRLAVYAPGGPEPVEAFGGDALEAARSCIDAGARWLQVVDMDLAFTGKLANLDVLAAVCRLDPEVRVQASGGIRTRAHAAAYLGAGAARVVMGSAALADEAEVRELVTAYGERVLAGIEVGDGRIRSRGAEPVDLDLMATLGWLSGLGLAGFLVTAVARVGTAAGPDLDVIRRVARSSVPTLAAGGISSVADLRAAREAGAVGAVVGRAALDGTLDLAEALAWAAA